jgi:hypothetical protein
MYTSIGEGCIPIQFNMICYEEGKDKGALECAMHFCNQEASINAEIAEGTPFY